MAHIRPLSSLICVCFLRTVPCITSPLGKFRKFDVMRLFHLICGPSSGSVSCSGSVFIACSPSALGLARITHCPVPSVFCIWNQVSAFYVFCCHFLRHTGQQFDRLSFNLRSREVLRDSTQVSAEQTSFPCAPATPHSLGLVPRPLDVFFCFCF